MATFVICRTGEIFSEMPDEAQFIAIVGFEPVTITFVALPCGTVVTF